MDLDARQKRETLPAETRHSLAKPKIPIQSNADNNAFRLFFLRFAAVKLEKIDLFKNKLLIFRKVALTSAVWRYVDNQHYKELYAPRT